MSYKNYYARRTTGKGLESDDSHCCPSRMPIIGPILFSLFIFSPLILPTSDTDKSPETVLDSTVEETLLPYDQPQPILEISDKDQQHSLP